MKKIFFIIFLSIFIFSPACAKSLVDTTATIHNEFDTKSEIPKIINFTINEAIIIPNLVEIPAKSHITGEIYRYQKELRWHKSAYIVIRLLNYTPPNEEQVDIQEKNVYLTARKYERFDGRAASVLTIEILGSSAVSFFAPGVDVAYFFLKGAIVRDMHPNWFKSGVSKAYDNSILWFIEKGKSFDLCENDEIKLEHIEGKKFNKTIEKIDKRKEKTDKKLAKKELKNKQKEEKEQIKLQKQLEKEAKLPPPKKEKREAKRLQKLAKKELKKANFEARYKKWEEKRKIIEDKREAELKANEIKKQERRALKAEAKRKKKEKRQRRPITQV